MKNLPAHVTDVTFGSREKKKKTCGGRQGSKTKRLVVTLALLTLQPIDAMRLFELTKEDGGR